MYELFVVSEFYASIQIVVPSFSENLELQTPISCTIESVWMEELSMD